MRMMAEAAAFEVASTGERRAVVTENGRDWTWALLDASGTGWITSRCDSPRPHLRAIEEAAVLTALDRGQEAIQLTHAVDRAWVLDDSISLETLGQVVDT